jgi:hypothetical protein
MDREREVEVERRAPEDLQGPQIDCKHIGRDYESHHGQDPKNLSHIGPPPSIGPLVYRFKDITRVSIEL